MSSKLPPPARLRLFVVASKDTLVFVPWNLGLSVSSLLVCANKDPCVSGKSKIIDVELALNIPESSANLSKYSPSNLGTVASVVLPANASIRSTELEKVAAPEASVEWRTYTLPPCVTSTSVDKSHLSLISLSDIGSAVRFCTFAGTAVFPTALNVISEDVALISNAALYMQIPVFHKHLFLY